MADRGKKDPDPPVEWAFLTAEGRQERRQRLRRWLERPDREQAGQVVSDLQDLAVDVLVRSAFDQFFQHQQEIGAPPQREGRPWEKHQQEAEKAAASAAQGFCNQLRSLVRRDPEATRAALLVTMNWWSEKARAGSSGDLDFLLERQAATLAAVLAFQNLGRAEGATSLVWDVLLRRVVQGILIPRLKWPRDEDSVADCGVAILERAAGFTYQGLGPAIEFFTEACRLRKKQKPPEIETEPLPDEAPGDQGGGTVPTFEEEEFPEEQPSSARSARKKRLWEWMNQALKRDEALRFWILFLLKEDHKQEWPDLVRLVEHSRWPLSDDDLPPDVTWEEVQQAFQDMANRSRKAPGTLTTEALKQFYSRANRNLKRSAREHPEADPRR